MKITEEPMRGKDEERADECLMLLMAFMKVSDRKARAKVIKFAEQCAHFDCGGIVVFGQAASPDRRSKSVIGKRANAAERT